MKKKTCRIVNEFPKSAFSTKRHIYINKKISFAKAFNLASNYYYYFINLQF